MIYAKLGQNEDSDLTLPHFEDDQEFTTIRKRFYGCSRKYACFSILILSSIICLILIYIPQIAAIRKPSKTPSMLHCGSSATEARELGCVFDLLTNNWMPEICSDPVTDAEYRAWVLETDRELGAWAFFYDKNAEHRVGSEQELSNLVGHQVYTTTQNHLAHCAFLARRMHRLIDGEIAAVAHNPLKHTVHCTSAIIDAISTLGHLATTPVGSVFVVGTVSCSV